MHSAIEFDKGEAASGGLAGYLQQTALISDADAYREGSGAVSLMTLHTAKGLEFAAVMIVGVEDGIIPHSEFERRPRRRGGTAAPFRRHHPGRTLPGPQPRPDPNGMERAQTGLALAFPERNVRPGNRRRSVPDQRILGREARGAGARS